MLEIEAILVYWSLWVVPAVVLTLWKLKGCFSLLSILLSLC
jgi:hypothetical protein